MVSILMARNGYAHTMTKQIVLLTPDEQAPDLITILRRHAPDLAITQAIDLDSLQRACGVLKTSDRLLAFATPVIVPADVLGALPGPAYNFHGGPPAYPGLFPASFAIYEGADTFGVTAHEMTAQVDQGAIVAVDTIPMPTNIDRLNLEALSREMLLALVDRLAPALLKTDAPLPVLDIAWAPHVRRMRDFEALCELPKNVDQAEFQHRYRAVGEGPFHALRIPVHGRWFRLESVPGDGTVYRGGQAVMDD